LSLRCLGGDGSSLREEREEVGELRDRDDPEAGVSYRELRDERSVYRFGELDGLRDRLRFEDLDEREVSGE